MASNHETAIIFIQGDQSFFESTLQSINTFELKVIFVCSDPTFFTAEGWRESHAANGGVTDGWWTCYAQNLLLPVDLNATNI